MDSPSTDVLRRAAEFLRSGKPHLARPTLIAYMQEHPASEQGWLLLSMAVTDQRQKIDCLQRVLRINPANAEAQAKLVGLLAPSPTPSPAREAPPEATPAPSHFQSIESNVPSSQSSFGSTREQRVESIETDRAAPHPSGPLDIQGLREAMNRAPARRAPARRASKVRFTTSQWAILIGMALLILGTISIAIVLLIGQVNQSLPNQASGFAAVVSNPTVTPIPSATVQSTWTPTTFPPTWTPTPHPSATPTRTPTPFPTVNATLSSQMDTIERQVADLRGLTIEASVPRVLIGRDAVEHTLRTMLVERGYLATLLDQARSLSALGLIKPTYDLVKYAMNGLADNVGGFYIPWLKQLFVIGASFHGVERFVFAHEFDHALTDQHFNISGLGVYPDCLSNNQRCAAIRALVEGDATLIMQQWLRQYAGPQDYLDIVRYRPPSQTLPEDFPPPYVSRDLAFPYDAGLRFVEYLHNRGNWADVNKAYANLPASTEQILHPEKYLADEPPLEVSAPPLTDTLGAEWRSIDDNVLGEWTTYLILRAGADVAAQLKEDAALTASRGWGGDHYQVYYNDTVSQTVLAAEWVWDTPRDAAEFKQAMLNHLDERFRGAQLDHANGNCWQSNGQTSCLFSIEKGTLWLLAPDVSTLDAVLTAYPDFQ